MRVTQSQITRQYMNNSNSSLENMNKISNKVLTQRKFLRASEDSVGAAKAMVIRRNLAQCKTYSDNLDTAEGVYSSAETALLSISDISSTLTDRIIYGANGTNGTDEKAIIANEIREVAKQMITQINTKYGDRQLFGGTNNASIPYVYNESTGLLTYNGVDINAHTTSTDFPMQKDIFVDAGLGIKFDAAGNVDKQTVMNLSLSGAKILGCGTDSDGDSLNLIALAFSAADAIQSGDASKALNLLDKVEKAKSKLLIGISNIGTLEQSVEYNREKVASDKYNLQVAQKSIESCDLTEEMTNYTLAEAAYNATLSMGTKIIPMSIFDFM